jgi:carbonic anhydrase
MSEPSSDTGTSGIDALLIKNHAYAAVLPRADGDGAPRTGVAVVACMDARIDVFAVLGLAIGDAQVIRNAGGVVSEDVIRSLLLAQTVFGVREIMLLHHTDCGMLRFGDDELRERVRTKTGVDPPFALETFDDLDSDVVESIARIRSSPYLHPTDAVRGFVYDLDSGCLREVTLAL